MQVYEGAASFAASSTEWDLRREHGVAFDLLDSPEQIADIQPGWSTLYPRRLHPRLDQHHRPGEMDGALARCLYRRRRADRGGRVQAATSEAACWKPRRASAAPTAVIAAGAWSHRRRRPTAALETERGYYPAPGAFDLRTQLTFSEHGFVVSRIGEGLRVGGASSSAGSSWRRISSFSGTAPPRQALYARLKTDAESHGWASTLPTACR